jgi:hypothetical protein
LITFKLLITRSFSILYIYHYRLHHHKRNQTTLAPPSQLHDNMMDRELDPSLQQILDNASGIHHQDTERSFANDHFNNEPPLGFTFQPAPPRQHGQGSSSIREQTVQGHHYNGSRYLSRSTSDTQELQPPAPYLATNIQGRLTFPPRHSHVFQQADSEAFNNNVTSRVLTSADNYFKVLQDLDQSVPRSHPPLSRIPTSRLSQNQQPSPITQLANNMFSQTSMPLPRSNPFMSQNIFQTETNKIRELQPQKQQFTPPFTLSLMPQKYFYETFH